MYSGSGSEVFANVTSIWNKLLTAACWSGKKKGGNCEANLVFVESDFGTTDTNHSQCSLPVEALNLIVESKCQPAELNNLTINLHAPSRRKKSLQSYCSVDFDFLALIDMTFHVSLRDDSSFGKLTNSCNFTFTGNV